MKIENLKPGMVVHSYGKTRQVRPQKCSWPVRIISVDLEARTVTASWNSNPASIFGERSWKRWRLISFYDAQQAKR